MTDHHALQHARVDDAVFALRPDYRALLITATGLVPGPSDAESEALLQRAESHARQALLTQQVDQLGHIAAWREAYRAFGAKPRRTRNSVEALTRRAEAVVEYPTAGEVIWADDQLHAAADELATQVSGLGPEVRIVRRLLQPTATTGD